LAPMVRYFAGYCPACLKSPDIPAAEKLTLFALKTRIHL
jgi:hypothetical protein